MHPSVKIVCLIALALATHLSNGWQLAGIGGILSAVLYYYRATGFWKLLRRVRWLLFFLLLIFAFNTSGEYLRLWPFELAPTYEGMFAGLLQSAKICVMLGGIALLLATTNRESLIAGFYLLAIPLRILRLNPERFAARLWLTLYYVEQAPKGAPLNNVRDSIFDKLEVASFEGGNNEGPELIHLKLRKLGHVDLLVVAVLTVAGIYLLCA